MSFLIKCYRFVTRPLKGRGLNKSPLLMRISSSIIRKISPLYVDLRQGFKLMVEDEEFVSYQYHGEYEPVTTQVIKDQIKKGDVVVDIGANIGYYTILFSRLVGSDGLVYSFEPGPKNFSMLKQNVELNGCKNVILEQKAVAGKSGIVELFLHERGGNHSIVDAKGCVGLIKVDCVSLQDYFKDRRVDLIKMDVEGAEYQVVKGADAILNSGVKLVIEFNIDSMTARHIDSKKLLKILSEKGYRLKGINEGEKRILEITEDDFDTVDSTYNGKTLNVLCLKELKK